MTTPVTIGFAGSSNTANAFTGYRPLTMVDVLSNMPAFEPTFLNIAVSGWATWPNLVNLADLAAADLIIFDQSNDDSGDAAHDEAFIRNAWAQGNRVISVIIPSFDSTGNEQVTIPNNETVITNHLAITTAYGIPVINYWEMCKSLVPGTYDLTDLMADTAHPTALGFQLIETALRAYVPTGGEAQPDVLPARVNAASEDFQETPVIKNGTDDDSRTGTWAENGTSVSSSDVGATITYSGTFRMFGCYRADATYPDVSVAIDGGDPINPFAFYANGYDIGTRAAHTVVITVLTTCKIDEFWAI